LKALQPLYHDGVQPAVEAIHRAIKATFLAVDAQIVQQPTQYLLEQSSSASPPTNLKAVGARLLQTARSGSCALVAFYEANIRHLHVTVVGDSRAILGRRRKVQDGGPLYEVHVLSADQTPRNPKELARTTAEHPGEDLAQNGRFLGWAITRAFGNGTMKWSLELQEFLLKNFLGSPTRSVVKTPPYFTAEPEITLTTVEPGDFMIMASDGLWDCLTNEEVVGLVGIWLERTHGEPSKGTVAPRLEQEVARDDLPVELKEDKTQNYENWNAQKRFVNVDSNVAHHLARNAFGGADDDLHNALLSTAAPRARYIRYGPHILYLLWR
jgi:pyruvate dehydrogenase phosphatase